MEPDKHCKIERIGIVMRIEEQQVVLEVEGKLVNVPRAKTSDSLEVNDSVRWSRTIWIKIME
ncbi:hypothetical protein PALU110988_05300 [Paenibacillus lupini]|uniref:hypothetical protein n=1 Tax=Paenibacillus lupini TaxID=1450204 RepID=UPI001423208A|nr:hypothetical protein [Paenibacillus lupini]NIK25281.1 hypothetical protein [Paenibacillus lupini]